MNTRTDTNANFPAPCSHRYLTLFGCVSPMASRNQARTNDKADVIGTWFDFVEITRSNRGSRRGKSEAAKW